VARDAKGPVSLNDGAVTVVALDAKPCVARRTEAASALPDHYFRVDADDIDAHDADWTDNTDEFAVRVAGPTGGAGGGQVHGGAGADGAGADGAGADGAGADGAGADGAGADGGGSDGGTAGTDHAGGNLPVTGPTVLTFGGAGLAAVALGIGLLAVARRRRVVPIIPTRPGRYDPTRPVRPDPAGTTRPGSVLRDRTRHVRPGPLNLLA
jgi:hypothetical protein